MEPISPSVWRKARRKTARKVSAVRIASGEYHGWPPRVVRGTAAQSRDCFLREPDGQAPALAQAGLIVRPVGHLTALPWDMVTAVPVQLERHEGHLDQEEHSPMADRLPAP